MKAFNVKAKTEESCFQIPISAWIKFISQIVKLPQRHNFDQELIKKATNQLVAFNVIITA
jgi:hypothetical protein